MVEDHPLLPLRKSGLKAITAFIWANVAAIGPVGWYLGHGDVLIGVLIGAIVALLPTYCYLKQRIDAGVRAMLGLSVIAYPILFVWLFHGDPWQIDMHMYFFVCFSLLVLLCDIRSLMVAATVTLLHHLIFFLVMPEWVFPGSGSIARVLLHGFLVACEVAILASSVRLITQLYFTNERARKEADAAREAAERALARSRDAEQRAERERTEREAAEATLQAATNDRRREIAAAIDAGVGALTKDLRRMAEELATHGTTLTGISESVVSQALDVRRSSERSVSAIASVAVNADQLSDSIRLVGDNARDAQDVATHTADAIRKLAPSVSALSDEVASARDILALVSEIAGQSNLLALNATIEAARSGEAGHGFAVVAGEMKQMAQATSRAAEQISGKLAAITGAAEAFRNEIATTTAQVGRITESSTAIASAVEQQRIATDAIAEGADDVRSNVTGTDQRSLALNDVATENSTIATRTTELARQLDRQARDLNESMDALLQSLRAA
ncbi:methyl-accepting chemotaxis protein [Stakelama marina]|uniref:Methyl-accepting transducer domain-containing protein n=1 Tax=Stakelama marina TaxID=2826939 RepID=A0A8T4I8T3_9SPHN|nr:methyl-accepting chemotaxis protein [Stakelama marina]MBR0551067.1 hypothetical protein [Stakelama marina]